MNEVFNLLREIFMLKSEDNVKVGLTQFKAKAPVEEAIKKPIVHNKQEVKLSDLMRRSY